MLLSNRPSMLLMWFHRIVMTVHKKYHTEIVRPAILKRDSYCCKSCGVRNKQRVYNNSRGKYVECDDFIEQWAIANGKKVYSVGLVVIEINPYAPSSDSSNYVSLCKKCAKKHKKQVKKAYKSLFLKEMETLREFSVNSFPIADAQLVVVLRDYIENLTSVRLTTDQIVVIIELLSKNK